MSTLGPLRDSEVDVLPAVADARSGNSALDGAIYAATTTLLEQQVDDGYWCTEFEADCTIPSEYVLMTHFMDEVDAELEQKLAVYLRSKQNADGGWSLYPGGPLDVSCSVKAYFALKLAGDEPNGPHMKRAREAILARGGAAKANVFTHIALALFEQMPWRGVPFIPVEIMLLPKWFPFHIRKVSYWSRAVMVPLFVLCTLKPKAVNPRGIHIRELFTTPPEDERDYFRVRSGLNRVFLGLDKLGRFLELFVPPFVRNMALKRAENWIVERLNGHGGLGAIFPAMVNAYEALAQFGYAADHPHRVTAQEAIRQLLVIKPDIAYCQPCVSPVWDTGLSCLALQAAAPQESQDAVTQALDWLAERQLLDAPGDWRESRPHLRGGGWAFQFENTHYPDIDDTPVVAWAMLQSDRHRYAEAIERAAEWIVGMQSSNGGWASFDVDNTYEYLNEIPFADHGALLDPPTSDVTARCLTFLGKYDSKRFQGPIERGLDFLRTEQEENGAWFGRWGTNYIYGTWCVLTALEAIGLSRDNAMVDRAVAWLTQVQRDDGGWGETNHTYFDPREAGQHDHSTSFQTAWAVLALLAAGDGDSDAVRRGRDFLLSRQRPDAFWVDRDFTAPGFPRVFYLKYHGYTAYFPLWALAGCRNAGVV